MLLIVIGTSMLDFKIFRIYVRSVLENITDRSPKDSRISPARINYEIMAF